MIFKQLHSSSKGNLYTVTAKSGERLLIESGVTWKKTLKALEYKTSNIVGCLLTHEHADHSKSIEDVMRSGINVYSGNKTFEALNLSGNRRAIPIKHNFLYNIGKSFRIMPFDISHDAAEPFGFVVFELETKEYLLFVTDTNKIENRFDFQFSIIAIECSYERDCLKERVSSGEIPELVARRLLDSHMEKYAAISYVEKWLDLSKCTEIHLIHMSGGNIVKKYTAQEFEDKFLVKTVVI